MFTFWETYVAGIEYFAIYFVPMVIAGMVAEKSEGGGAVVGCVTMLLMPVLQVAAMAIMILTISPIIFGFAEDAVWSFPWQLIGLAPAAFFKLIGVLVIAVIALAFLPFLGQLHSLQTLVLGGIALTFVLGILDSVDPGIVKGRVDLVPSFWFSVGLIIIGGVMSWIGTMVVAAIATAIDMAEDGLGQLMMMPVAGIFGFVPVFIYGAWLGAQVRGGF